MTSAIVRLKYELGSLGEHVQNTCTSLTPKHSESVHGSWSQSAHSLNKHHVQPQEQSRVTSQIRTLFKTEVSANGEA